MTSQSPQILQAITTHVSIKLPDIVFQIMFSLQFLANEVHGQGSNIDDQISLPSRKMFSPITNLIKPTEGLKGFCHVSVDIRTERVRQNDNSPANWLLLFSCMVFVVAGILFL